jgi:S-adenosylmethionine-dependent methyltransferase
MGDRNFDDLAHRFEKNIRASTKGEIRQAVLARDFAEFVPPTNSSKPPRVLDAGGGQGQMSLYFAERGYEVVLCDVSVEMLKRAKAAIDKSEFGERITLYHGAIQQYLQTKPAAFDVVLCHAVLEWVQDGQNVLRSLSDITASGGMLSLLYYNLHGLVFKNLLRTNFKKIASEKWQGGKRSLTPTYPLTAATVNSWISELPFEVLCESGVRVFNDFVFSREDREREPEKLLEYELTYSRQKPYQDMGRYIHLLLLKT